MLTILVYAGAAAGRAYAAYGGVYIVASILWLWLVENSKPDRWDVTGAVICLVGCRCYSASDESLARSQDIEELPDGFPDMLSHKE